MQVLNQNSSTSSTVGLNLPKPVPPQSLTAKTNTPVKNPLPAIDKKNNTAQNVNQFPKTVNQTPQEVKPIASSAPPTANVTTSTPVATTPSLASSPAVNTSPTISSLPTPIKSSSEKMVPTEEIGKKDKNKKDKKAKKDKKTKKDSDNKSEEKGTKKAGKKRIPTILGLIILIVSLVAGVLLFGDGTGLFTPRATPETTPKNIKLSNVTDKSFTVSFYTEEETIGFIKYGTDANDIKQQASDDRDQLSGVVKPYRLHHVTVRGLEPNKNYYYLLGTGNNATFDDADNPYQIQTALNPGNASPNNQTIYGTITQANGQPGEGALVFVTLEGAGVLSTVVKSSGSWAISLANAFNLNLNDYANVDADSTLSIKVQGVDLDSITNRVLSVVEAQPAPDIVMGQEAKSESEDALTTRDELLANTSREPEEIQENEGFGETPVDPAETNDSIESPVAEPILSDADRTLDLSDVDESSSAEDNVVNSTQPIIKTQLPPNITVKVQVHSDTAIETVMTTDANGELVLDVASLEQSLGPGEHTVVYTYIDPNTGQEVTESYDFVVAATTTDNSRDTSSPTRTIASAETNQTLPHGTGDPYLPPTTVTPTSSPVPVTPTTTTPTVPSEESTTSTRETVVSTESGTYNAGSVFGTFGLLALGLFFLLTGVWSFLLAKQFEKN